MTREELNSLVDQWENAKVDFKRQWYWNDNMPNNIKETNKNEFVKDIIALTNGDVYSTDKTAYLIIGIDDNTREIYNFDKSTILPLDKLKQQLLTLLNNYAQPEFLALDIELVDEVLVISIPPRGSLISLSKDLKLKNNNTDRKGTTYYRVGEDIRVASSEVVGEFEKVFGKDKQKATKELNKKYYLLGSIVLIGILYLGVNLKERKVENKTQITDNIKDYTEQNSGVKIIFAKDKKTWEKIIAYGQSKLTKRDSESIQKALTKASLRAKANISKFLKVDIKTDDTIKEISHNENVTETLISTISESSNAILRGVEVSKYKIDINNVLFVKAIVSRKSIEAVNKIK